MTTENNTTQAPAATLNEAELFAEFYESEFAQYDTRGKEEYRFSVASLLQPCGGYCEIDFCIVPGDEGMSDHLEEAENELLGALSDLQLARRAWEDFKAERMVDEDTSTERFTVAAAKEAA